MTKTQVRRILFDGNRAIGVEIERDGQIQRIGARRELIISGGAINSPVLLLASGVGVPWALEAQELLRNDWGVVADVWQAMGVGPPR